MVSGKGNKHNWTGPVNVVEGPFKHLPFLVRKVRSIRDEPVDELSKIFATLAGPPGPRAINGGVRHLPRGGMLWKRRAGPPGQRTINGGVRRLPRGGRRRCAEWAGVSSAVTTMESATCIVAPMAAMCVAKFRWKVALWATAIRVRRIRDADHIPLSGRNGINFEILLESRRLRQIGYG